MKGLVDLSSRSLQRQIKYTHSFPIDGNGPNVEIATLRPNLGGLTAHSPRQAIQHHSACLESQENPEEPLKSKSDTHGKEGWWEGEKRG